MFAALLFPSLEIRAADTAATAISKAAPLAQAGGAALESIARQNYSFNQNWEFFRPEDHAAMPQAAGTNATAPVFPAEVAWEKVHLPHTARLEPLNASGGQNFRGVCWYRKTITPEPAWQGKKMLLRFEGAMQVADLWLNDQKLTTHFGGYQPFTLDLSAICP
jgi:beta-galactosidase